MPSPYPWSYTLRWPFYYYYPSIKQHTRLKKMPLIQSTQLDQSSLLKIVFCGDIMVMQGDTIPRLHHQVSQFISNSDILIGNCESPLGHHKPNPNAHYGIKFNMSKDYLSGIIHQTSLAPSKWYLSMANNHTGDMGYQAAIETEHIMKELQINPLGRWKNDHVPLTVLTIKGIKVGIIAWTEWMNCNIFSNIDPVVLRRNHIENIEWKKIKDQLQIDNLIAFPHWGYEFQHFPYKESRCFAKNIIENNAVDLIVGAHTHTLQPLEKFSSGLCFYNLGNFCGLGVAWPVRIIPLLKVFIDTTSKKIESYELKIFAQINNNNQVNILPISLVPEKFKRKVMERVHVLYE